MELRDDFIWCQKYRPRTIQDCILPKGLKDTFLKFVDNGDIPNLLLSGTAGTGKTTVARALCEELGVDYIIINGSESGNIDTLRNDVRNFASGVSITSTGKRKIVILDEADYLNPQSTQPALRGFIEEFSKNCGFIFTCNFKNRIIEPIHSRCSVIDFRFPKKDRPGLAGSLLKRVIEILNKESVDYNEKVLVELIMKYFPDFRRVLNELQRYSVSGEIDAGILTTITEQSIKNLMQHLKEKNFKNMRKWVVENLDDDPSRIFRLIYDGLYGHVKLQSIPQAVILLGNYQYKAAFAADAELNLVACLTELMRDLEYKSS
jgi:DNA polymerase III delta prime subunit